MEKSADLNHESKNSLTQVGREQGILRLMSINLLKRLGSSVHSSRLSLKRIQDLICSTLDTIAHYDPSLALGLNDLTNTVVFDADDQEMELFTVGKKVIIAPEDTATGVSITNLGLNEFHMELMEYAKTHPELEACPSGISAVAAATPDAPVDVVFILKNVHNEVNIDNRNRLHPYYLVYLTEDGVTVHDHLSSEDTLDAMRQLCRGKDKPLRSYTRHYQETGDGRNMAVYSNLLEDVVLSILNAREDSDLDSLFWAGSTSALLSQVSGLDDFQLVCFLVVR